MKLVKNFVYATLLTSMLAISASAGDQLGGGIAAPPPPPPRATITQDEPGICDPNTGCLSTETSDSLFYEALAALLSVY